ncbi:MAG: SDR family oxidoreductase [Candidatus Altiarchaeota archaeon]|nr:SDR family oxidoreductase [Candidatus Altiarchaeota archaeon]
MASRNAALVTGAAKRIGAEIALHLAGRGYDIALHYGISEKQALETAEKVRGHGVSCELFQTDFKDLEATEKLLSQVKKTFPNLNLLVNNAAVFQSGRISETCAKKMVETFQINFISPYLLMREFHETVKKGSIINMLDERITRYDHTHSAYTLSKKALRELTYMASREFAPKTRVNAIAPGYVLPPTSENPDMKKVLKQIPMGGTGEVKDVLSAFDYLIDSDYVTGQIMYVDGGRHV